VTLEVRLGWRNVWRNPRRTALSVAATVFAVFLVVFFVAMAAGLHGKMIEDSVRLHSGHVTISGPGYLENRTLEHFLDLDPQLAGRLEATPRLTAWAPRVVSFALLSKTSASQGVVILGVDPEREGAVTTLPDRVSRGSFLDAEGERQIVLGERLARSLGAEIGDELLVFGVAYTLETAYELFRVVGLIRLPEPALERSLAIISLSQAQKFFVYDDRVSEIAVLASDAGGSGPLRDHLRAALAVPGEARAEVHGWEEVMPELEQLIFLDDAGMYILLVILIIVVGFGILNTILMAVLERTRELGVMLALGLRPASIFRIVYLESLFLAGIGLAIGLAAALPTVLWLEGHPMPLTGAMEGTMELFGIEPLITWKLKPLNPLGSTLTIFGVASLAALYPARKASRGRPVDALRSL
jgi:ABC-type lipoprotein release transport system permease subunit